MQADPQQLIDDGFILTMYEDDVWWVVPGSHIRPNTETENQQLLDNSRVPIEGSIPVKLKAGNGVI